MVFSKLVIFYVYPFNIGIQLQKIVNYPTVNKNIRIETISLNYSGILINSTLEVIISKSMLKRLMIEMDSLLIRVFNFYGYSKKTYRLSRSK